MLYLRRFRLTLGLSAVVLALTAPGAVARTATQTAESGSFSASFSFRPIGQFEYGRMTLTIRSGGAVQYRQPVSSPFCRQYCQPGDPGKKGASIAFRRLSSSGTQLVLDLYSGGAHCCSIIEVFDHTPRSDRWTKSSYNFGDPGYELVHLDQNARADHNAGTEFLSEDDRFAYAFTDYAASGMPLLILRWSDNHFVNVTRSYPAKIARDASGWMKAFRSQRHSHFSDTTGVIAAWAADEDELGHGNIVSRFLRHAAGARERNSGLGNEMPENARFVVALNRFLRKTGYAR